MATEQVEERKPSALSANIKLIAKSAVYAAGVLVAYVIVGALFHWVAFWIAAGDIWSTLRAGPGPAHAPAAAVIWLVVLLFTPQGLVSVIYLLGMPVLCFFLGQRAALGAAVGRILREKRDALVDFVVGASMRVGAVAGATPGAERAGNVARRLRDSIEGMDASRTSRFILRSVFSAIRVPELLSTTDLVTRIKTDPDGARAELRAAVEPRIAELGGASSFRPLAFVLGFTTVVTATRSWWCRLL